MPKCPQCSEEISHLKYEETGVSEVYNFYLGKKTGFPMYDLEEDFCDGSDSEFQCPKCAKTLFTKEEEAVAFLKGEKEKLPEIVTVIHHVPDEDAQEFQEDETRDVMP